jgi:hypothetical protein
VANQPDPVGSSNSSITTSSSSRQQSQQQLQGPQRGEQRAQTPAVQQGTLVGTLATQTSVDYVYCTLHTYIGGPPAVRISCYVLIPSNAQLSVQVLVLTMVTESA